MQSKSEKRWLMLWKRIGASGDAHGAYLDLVARYSEPHRFYHTFEHIRRCLDELDGVRHLTIDPDAVEMALWYHDAIYNPGAEDNEEKSAELALEVIKNACLSDEFGQRVANLILATKHTVVPGDFDTQLLVDIDLSSFGQTEEKFDEYGRQVRREHEWVLEEEFTAGRTAIFKSFLERPAIYLTFFFRNKYEAQARQNINRAIAQLTNRP